MQLDTWKLNRRKMSLTNFGDFCTFLNESPQSQFNLSTYEKLQFSAKIK